MNNHSQQCDDITTTTLLPEAANSNNNNSSTSSWISEAVTRPTHNDVLFGRGGGVNRHVGNIHFRQLVSKYEHDYRATHRKADKTDISARIVSIIRTLDPPGRFLKNMEGVWRDVGDEKARNKTSQALRERGPSNGVNHSSNSGKTSTGVSGATLSTTPNDDSTDTNTTPKPRRNRKAMLLRVKCKLDRASSTWSCISIRGSKTNKRNSKKQINRVGVVDDDQKQMDTVLDTPIEIEDIACHEKMPSCSTNEGVFRTTAYTSTSAGTKLVRKVTDPALYNSSTDGTASTSSSSASLGSLQDDGVQALLQLANVC
mmetsp:Transcript_18656/g.27672  ORF Transcript_18656/g.27672 Transcript_18656/m.27672 type:complete len:314 (-) Transcript_18656:985-1926(-)